MKPWYQEHFQEDYLRIYKHRDEQRAARELEQIMTYVPVQAGLRGLDLCCGDGRHCRWLARSGVAMTGIDLSPALLKQALDMTGDLPVQYRRADVRHFSYQEEMDLVFNLFTSFGYFTEDEENEQVFAHAAHALKTGGYFIFDYLNPPHVKSHLVPYNEDCIDDLRVKQNRKIENGYVIKEITIQEGNSKREYIERVKLYNPDEIENMLLRNQLEPLYTFGDYDASTLHREQSPRQIWVCRKV
ncbi:class I SAM-dependent methyltransferase [Salsuginibacillus kocurii]|uniref:class I SAM-dependent methyltransferase n=1 Tax=Salsuginibacillus kocurii TaxID=427078 RepID=UPI000380FA9E|nr:class I SAM-dependent methyltransferase [Salsuginibacillus kocurii]